MFCWEKEIGHKREPTAGYHLFILELKFKCWTEMGKCDLWWYKPEQCIIKIGRWYWPRGDTREPSGVLEMFYIFICMTATQVHPQVKTHWVVQFRFALLSTSLCVLHPARSYAAVTSPAETGTFQPKCCLSEEKVNLTICPSLPAACSAQVSFPSSTHYFYSRYILNTTLIKKMSYLHVSSSKNRACPLTLGLSLLPNLFRQSWENDPLNPLFAFPPHCCQKQHLELCHHRHSE